MSAWTVAMLASGALFSATVAYFTWVRIPQWRELTYEEFRADFGRWLRRADAVQPMLAVAFLVSTVRFAQGADGANRLVAWVAAGGLAVSLVGSVAVMVPLQRRLAAGRSRDPEQARQRWYRGHLVRTSLVMPAFALAVMATI